MRRRRTQVLVAQSLLGVALLVAWLYIVDFKAVVDTLRRAQWGFVVIAGAIGLLSTLIRALRWRLVLRPIARVPRLDVWLVGLASSLINFVIPIRTGEIARSVFLKQRDEVPISSSLPTVLVDRSLDLLMLLLIGAAGIVGGLRVGASLSIVLVFGAALFTGFATFMILAIFWHDRLMVLAAWAVPRFLGSTLRNRILGILEGLIAGFTTIGRQPRVLAPLLLMSFAAALLDATLIYLLFLTVGSPVAPQVALTGYALFALTFIVPGAPGYIGSFEAFGSLVFGALGVPQAAAASAVLIFHALEVVLLGVAGGLAIWALGFRPSSAFQTVAEARPTAGIGTSDPRPSPQPDKP